VIVGYNFSSCTIDRVANDIVVYVNQGIIDIAELERQSLAGYAAVTGENYTSDLDTYEALDRCVIPLYGKFLKQLREIRPITDEVRQIHAIYIKGAEAVYRGFIIKKIGLETGDSKLISLSNSEIDSGRGDTEKWREALFALSKAHNVIQK
jgi:hypothetical protein